MENRDIFNILAMYFVDIWDQADIVGVFVREYAFFPRSLPLIEKQGEKYVYRPDRPQEKSSWHQVQ